MKLTPIMYSHYFKDVKGLDVIDVYRVLQLFEVVDPCIQHAVKKLLVPGKRGEKGRRQDVQEAITSLERLLNIWAEDDERHVDPEELRPKLVPMEDVIKGEAVSLTFQEDWITRVCQWFVTAGQLASADGRHPDIRQTAFYIGMQLEELAEKVAVVLGSGTNLETEMTSSGHHFKKGTYDDAVGRALLQDPVGLLDGDIDVLWVTIGAARAQGADISGACEAVYDANMAKFPGGVVMRNPETGKVIKPKGWQPPDLNPFTGISAF